MTRLMLLVFVLLATVPIAGPAAADDQSICFKNDSAPDAAIEACGKLISSGKLTGIGLGRAYQWRGTAYGRQGQDDRAIADWSEAIRLDPKSKQSYASRSFSYNRKGDYDRAVADANEAIRLDPNHAAAYHERGIGYGRQGQDDRAIADWSEAIRLDPKSKQSYASRSFSYNRKGDYDRAIADANEAIRLDPKYVNAYGNRGFAYNAKGDYDRAIADYTEVIRLDPKNAGAFTRRGIAFEAKGQVAPALQDYRAALDRDRSNKSAADAINRLEQKLALGEGAKSTAPAPAVAAVSPPQPSPAAAPPGPRVALVIGNGNYRHVGKLPNPIVDARAMRTALTNLGFKVVYGEDLDKRSLERQIGQFAAAVKDAEVAFVYYAGHGSTFGDIPYVVPVDAEYEQIEQIPHELVQLESLVSELRRAKGVRIAILDACRDNEKEVELKRKDAERRGQLTRGANITRGLAQVRNADGLIVAYATQFLTTALDGKAGENSPFTASLVRHISTPGLDVKAMLFKVAQDVVQTTKGKQRPEISVSLYDEYELVRAR